jgi:hypothetical protein
LEAGSRAAPHNGASCPIARVNQLHEPRFRLAIPMKDAIAFALGSSDLGYENAEDETRQIIGALAMDALQHSEQWRAAGLLRLSLKVKWPDFAG